LGKAAETNAFLLERSYIVILNFGVNVAEFKLVVSEPDSKKTYQKAFGDDILGKVSGKKMGDELDGGTFGLPGYALAITGGSDRSGFPMRLGIHGSGRPKVLISGGVGYKPEDPIRKRIRIRGERVDGDIAQINAKVTKKGQRPLAELWSIQEKAEGGEKKSAEKPAETKSK